MHTQSLALPQDKQSIACKAAMLSLAALSVYMLLIYPALASSTPMGNVLCAVVGFISGNLGRGLATLAIIIVGVGATLGKVSWGLAITVAVGISVIFNANTIRHMLVGGSTGC